MKRTSYLALCSLATIGGLLCTAPLVQAGDRLAGNELDGVEVRIEPRRPSTPSGGTSSAAPVTWAPPGAKPVRYDSLQLKGLSGSSAARLALINNQTFRTNESALVTLGDKRVRVECLAIRDRSVLIRVAGEAQPRELKLLSQAPIPALAPVATGDSVKK